MDDFSLLIWELLSVLNQHFRDLLFKLFRVTTFQKRPLSTSYVIPVLSNPSLAVTLLILQLKLAFKTDRELLGTLSDLRVLYRTALHKLLVITTAIFTCGYLIWLPKVLVIMKDTTEIKFFQDVLMVKFLTVNKHPRPFRVQPLDIYILFLHTHFNLLILCWNY